MTPEEIARQRERCAAAAIGPLWAGAEIELINGWDAALDEVERLRELIEERLRPLVEALADDLEPLVKSRYEDDKWNVHPAMQRKYERDMEHVIEARAMQSRIGVWRGE